MSCCNPRGCDDFFGGKFARRVAARYRKRGLDTGPRGGPEPEAITLEAFGRDIPEA